MSWICALGSALLGSKVWYLLLLVSFLPLSLFLLSERKGKLIPDPRVRSIQAI